MTDSSSKNSEVAAQPTFALATGPIFILGIMPRSGTNFLFDLLQMHPDCGKPGPISEDFMVRYGDPLIQYGKSVFSHWHHAWGVNSQLELSLYSCLGNGLVSFLTSLCEKRRVVTKTPFVDNLKYFPKVFPCAHLIILLRDGRAVVESGIKSFGWSYETSVHKWADAARVIVEFDESARNTPLKYLIVKYEDLTDNLEVEMKKILNFLDLDSQSYDFEAALNLPVRGSSIHRGLTKSAVHWNPIEKPSGFHLKVRWGNWSRFQLERFNWIAGSYMQSLGYGGVDKFTTKLPWKLLNYSLDIIWPMRSFLERNYKKVRWFFFYFKNTIKRRFADKLDSTRKL